MTAWWNAMRLRHTSEPSTNTKIVLSGDSLTAGGTISPSSAMLSNYLPTLAASDGVPNITTANYGYSGENISTWQSTRIDEVLTAAPKLAILRLGMNDCATEDATIISGLTAGIGRMRNAGASPAGKTIDEMSILLLGPNVAIYAPNSRTVQRMKDICGIMYSVAESTGCAFFDTANAFPDGADKSGYLDGFLTHPTAHFERLIGEALGPVLFLRFGY
ncbi:MAG: SGNH/GDSL hydrolase family protein [Hyphomicrobium sp.]